MLQHHIGLAAALMIAGFLIGVYGQISKSLTLTVVGIVIIAVISALFLGLGVFS